MGNNFHQSGGNDYYGGYGSGGYDGYGESGNTPTRSLGDYIVIIRERIWWLVVSVFVVFLGFALYALNAPKVYRSSATVEILREKDEVFQIEDVVSQEVRNSEDFNTEMMILQSLNIQAVNDRIKGSLRDQFTAPFEKGIDATLRVNQNVVQILANNRFIAPERGTLVVNVGFDHPDPEVAATVANFFAEEYIDFNRNKQIEGSLRAVDDLRSQADQQLAKIKEMEIRLADFKEKYGTLSVERSQDIDNQQLITINSRVEEDKRALDDIKVLMDQIKKARDTGKPLWELNFIANHSQVSGLLGNLSSIKISIATLSKKFRSLHPTMIAAVENLEETEREITSAVESAIASFQNEYERAEANFKASTLRLAEKQQDMIDIDRIRPEFDALQRDLMVNRELYNHYYNRLQQAAVTVTTEGETARIIDRALQPVSPFKPDIATNLIIGLVLGTGVGFGLVLILAFMDDKVKSSYDIESILGVPLIGIVPHIFSIDAQEKARIVADDRDKHTVESFRAMHSTLKLNEESRNAKVILTTSTIPSEGKSFVTTNSAITFALHGERTIIVDADFRMPNIAKGLDIDEKQGVIQFLSGEIELESAIIKDFMPNLDILPTGGSTKSPTQLLSNDRFAELIHDLRLRYDRVIIDTPPIATVSDALSILPLVDGVLLVIRFNMVKRKTAAMSIRRLRESNVPIFGAVLNNLNTHVAGYYYSHYYDKSYKSYKYYYGRDYGRSNEVVVDDEDVVAVTDPPPNDDKPIS